MKRQKEEIQKSFYQNDSIAIFLYRYSILTRCIGKCICVLTVTLIRKLKLKSELVKQSFVTDTRDFFFFFVKPNGLIINRKLLKNFPFDGSHRIVNGVKLRVNYFRDDHLSRFLHLLAGWILPFPVLLHLPGTRSEIERKNDDRGDRGIALANWFGKLPPSREKHCAECTGSRSFFLSVGATASGAADANTGV